MNNTQQWSVEYIDQWHGRLIYWPMDTDRGRVRDMCRQAHREGLLSARIVEQGQALGTQHGQVGQVTA